MAVVYCGEIAAGTGASGKFGESLKITRKWTIRVDDPATSRLAIVNANGVSWGDPHPDNASLKAMEFDLSPADDVGMRWVNTVSYYVPQNDKKPDENGAPASYWEASGGSKVVPCFVDVNGDTITNSAGDPLEGLEREEAEASWSLTKFYFDDSWATDAMACTNRTNDAAWSGGDADTWKCQFKGAKRRDYTASDGTAASCVETHWEFRYNADKWILKPWDVGFMEKVDANGAASTGGTYRAAILGKDKKPVKQPVALMNGVARAVGDPPVVINGGAGAQVYQQADFGDKFGTPTVS